MMSWRQPKDGGLAVPTCDHKRHHCSYDENEAGDHHVEARARAGKSRVDRLESAKLLVDGSTQFCPFGELILRRCGRELLFGSQDFATQLALLREGRAVKHSCVQQPQL